MTKIKIRNTIKKTWAYSFRSASPWSKSGTENCHQNGKKAFFFLFFKVPDFYDPDSRDFLRQKSHPWVAEKYRFSLFFEKRVTDRRTDRPTDRPTDVRTDRLNDRRKDRPYDKIARTHLKILFSRVLRDSISRDFGPSVHSLLLLDLFVF